MRQVVIRYLMLALMAGLLAACTRPPELVGLDNPIFPAASVTGASRVPVFMATTRAVSEVTGAFYAAERAPDLGFASVQVSIPPNHVPGEIERARRLPPDPRREFAILDPVVYGDDRAFVAALNRELGRRPPGKRDVLVFVHGYNNSVTDAVLRLAQFVEDSEFEGVAVLFSWASAAQVTRYVYDLNSALIARQEFSDTIRLINASRAGKIDVFAHSMGSLLVVETLVQAEIAGVDIRASKLGNIMLAAPDIDVDLFAAQLEYLPENERNFFVFVSRDDRILGFSRRISGGVSRVGEADAVALAKLGVTVIDISGVEQGLFDIHSKFGNSPEVVRLIGASLRDRNYNTPPRTPTFVEVLNGVPVLRALTQ